MWYNCFEEHATLAQSAEQPLRKRSVVGSSPTGGSIMWAPVAAGPSV